MKHHSFYLTLLLMILTAFAALACLGAFANKPPVPLGITYNTDVVIYLAGPGDWLGYKFTDYGNNYVCYGGIRGGIDCFPIKP